MIKFEEMIDIISRIESIDEYSNEEEIDDILDDVLYMFARECQSHFTDIVNAYKPSESTKPIKSTGKQIRPTEESYDDDESEYDDDDVENIRVPQKPVKRTTSTAKVPAKKSTRKTVKTQDDINQIFDGLLD